MRSFVGFCVAFVVMALTPYGYDYAVARMVQTGILSASAKSDCDTAKPAAGAKPVKAACPVTHHHTYYYRPYMYSMLHSYRRR